MTHGCRQAANLIAIVLLATQLATAVQGADEAQWIWSKEHSKNEVPLKATCYFRRTFSLKAPESGLTAPRLSTWPSIAALSGTATTCM